MSKSKPVFDADAYKRIQHDQWNEDAATWHRWGPTLQTWFGGVTQKNAQPRPSWPWSALFGHCRRSKHSKVR